MFLICVRRLPFLLVICACLHLAHAQFLTYEIPRPRITVFSPRGLRFIIPHEEGMTWGVLLANINVPLSISDKTAAMFKEVKQPRNNRWIFYDSEKVLKLGDIINYKIAVEHRGKKYYSGPHSFRVNAVSPLPNQQASSSMIDWPSAELSAGGAVAPTPRPPVAVVPTSAPRPPTPVQTRPPPRPPVGIVATPPTTKRPSGASSACRPSSTTVRGKAACKGELIFQEHFDTLDSNKWSHSVFIADTPDHEFCFYDKRKENSFVKDGVLHIRPTLTEATYGKNFISNGKLVLEGCTSTSSEECTHQANFGYIVPPVISSRLRTSPNFSFKYGRVEVRAKMALGDWLLSGIFLHPLKKVYGPRYDSGQVRLGMARGNRDLHCDDVDSGISQVESGVILTAGEDSIVRQLSSRELPNDQGWDQNFHVYRADWTADKIVIQIDGKVINTIFALPGGFGSLEDFSESPNPWKGASKFSPFDQEFYVALGVGVGGIHDFPDNCINHGASKPWRNGQPKAKLNFWKEQNNWYQTWDLQDGAMQVDYVKVYAL